MVFKVDDVDIAGVFHDIGISMVQFMRQVEMDLGPMKISR